MTHTYYQLECLIKDIELKMPEDAGPAEKLKDWSVFKHIAKRCPEIAGAVAIAERRFNIENVLPSRAAAQAAILMLSAHSCWGNMEYRIVEVQRTISERRQVLV